MGPKGKALLGRVPALLLLSPELAKANHKALQACPCAGHRRPDSCQRAELMQTLTSSLGKARAHQGVCLLCRFRSWPRPTERPAISPQHVLP